MYAQNIGIYTLANYPYGNICRICDDWLDQEPFMVDENSAVCEQF